MQTPVLNNRESIVMGQLRGSVKDAAGVPVLGPLLTFLPGLNLVDAAVLKKLREENKAFEANFKTKIASSRAPEQNPERVGMPILAVVGKDMKDAKPFAELPSTECEAYAAEILTVPTLKKWLSEEERGDVRLMIENRIRALEHPEDVSAAG